MLPHFFSVFTTGSVDTVPVETRKPVDSSLRSTIYTGKSKRCCLKWQILCDNLGHIIHVRGPFSSLDYDGHIWDKTYPSLGIWDGRDPTNPETESRYEVFIGDNHYMNCRQVAVPIKREAGRELEQLELQYNNFLGSVRSTIEQVFGYLKTWSIIGGVYRGMLLHDVGYRFLSSAFLLCCELYNARFSILGHNKRDIRVLARDYTGRPLYQPRNLTAENYRLRVNLHHQLSTRRIIFADFYRAIDVVSGCTSESFKRGDLVWLFDENNQDYIKAIVTGTVNQLYSCRSSCKKFVFLSVSPNILFPRSNQDQVKPVTSLFVISALPPVPIAPSLEDDHAPSLSLAVLDRNSSVDESKTEFEIEYDNIISLDNESLEEVENVTDPSHDEYGNAYDGTTQSENSPSIPEEIDEIDLSISPCNFFESLPSKTRICFSPSEDFIILQSDTENLFPSRWISDEIINFFIDSAN